MTEDGRFEQAGSDPSDFIARLLELKAISHEIGRASLPAAVRAFVEDEFARTAEHPAQAPGPEAVAEAEALFRAWVKS